MLRRDLLLGAAGLVAACAGVNGQHEDANGAPLSADEAGRPIAPVMINERGPFPCVIDTAAQRTGLGQTLIQELGLTPLPGGAGVLHGSSGAHSIPLYQLASLSVAGVTHERAIAVPILHRRQTSAHAVIGMDAFAGRRLTFDFAEERLSVAPSGTILNRGWREARVELMHGAFVIAPLRAGATDVAAVIDTGAARTAGNTALLQALGFDENALPPGEPITGVAGAEARTRIGRTESVQLTGEMFGALDIAFAHLPVFAALNLADRPALILGMDFLRGLRGLSVDFGARTLGLRR